MTYPGGKSQPGVYQTIINQIPPHTTFIEAFAGSAAIARNIAPSRSTILIDIDEDACRKLKSNAPPSWIVLNANAVEVLPLWRSYKWAFIYCDPPYLMETRSTRRPIYRHEFATLDLHEELLSILLPMQAACAISGYPSALYSDALRSWRLITYRSITRAGTSATECLWMNYPEPKALHDYRYLGRNFRERERIARRQHRWKRRLQLMDPLERTALLLAIRDPRSSSPDTELPPGVAMPPGSVL